MWLKWGKNVLRFVRGIHDGYYTCWILHEMPNVLEKLYENWNKFHVEYISFPTNRAVCEIITQNTAEPDGPYVV
jgi:hypothetical protein